MKKVTNQMPSLTIFLFLPFCSERLLPFSQPMERQCGFSWRSSKQLNYQNELLKISKKLHEILPMAGQKYKRGTKQSSQM